jgi:hypothetical protein
MRRGLQWGRVFLQFNGFPNPGIGRFIPAEVPDFFGQLSDYVNFCGDDGRRLELVCYADCQNPPLVFDPAFIDRVNDAVGGRWNILAVSAGNEYQKNGFNPAALRRPRPLASQTSIGPDRQPYTPEWDLSNMAAVRDDDFERKYKDIRDQYEGDNADGHDPPRPAHAFTQPIYVNEMIGIGDDNIPGNTTNDPFKCWTYVAGAKIMGAAGVCGHLRTGIFGDTPTPGGLGEQCMDAMVDAGGLPLGKFSFDHYERGNSPWESPNPNLPVEHSDREPITGPDGTEYPYNPAGSLRTHAMIQGSTAEVIAPGPGPEYGMVALPGWTIATPFRYRDRPSNVAICLRT